MLDFAILPRPLSLEEGELTPKGTYRRKVVEQRFAGLIEAMYRAHSSILQAGDVSVRLPQWWLRELGLTLQDVTSAPGGLRVPRLDRSLTLERLPGALQEIHDHLAEFGLLGDGCGFFRGRRHSAGRGDRS